MYQLISSAIYSQCDWIPAIAPTLSVASHLLLAISVDNGVQHFFSILFCFYFYSCGT